MKLIRSWPLSPPAGRPHVVDDAIRNLNDRYDYRGLADVGDDVLHLDWDMAVSRADLVAFSARARQTPNRVLVAPTIVEADSRKGLPHTVWAHRRYVDSGDSALRNVEYGEDCHLFGFGMLYLPRDLIVEFIRVYRERLDSGMVFCDTGFATWYCREVQRETPIMWEIHPVHVHYSIASVPL